MKFNKLRPFHWDLIKDAQLYGKFDMPILKPVKYLDPDISFVPFHSCLSIKDPSNYGFDCYEDDYQFERLWNKPNKYTPILEKFRCGIGPDFSMYLDMPRSQQIWNCWRNKVLTYYLQSRGLTVIPNANWSDLSSLDWAFDGLPSESVLAVSSQGCMKDYVCKQAFLNGLHELVRQKHPVLILVYGLFPEEWKTKFSVPIVCLKTFCALRWGKY